MDDATAEVNNYLHVTTDVTDSDSIVAKLVFQMVKRAYLAHQATAYDDPTTSLNLMSQFATLGITDPLELTRSEERRLSSLPTRVDEAENSYVFNTETGGRVH